MHRLPDPCDTTRLAPGERLHLAVDAGTALVTVTHDEDFVAAVADRRVRLLARVLA